MTAHIFNFGQFAIKAVERTEERSFYAKTRVFGAVDALEPAGKAKFDELLDELFKLERDGDDRANDVKKQMNRARRETLKNTKTKLVALLGAMSDVFGRQPEVQTFSAKAGCSCGCSPGFILTSRLSIDGKPVDLWIE